MPIMDYGLPAPELQGNRFWSAIDKLAQTWPAKMAQSAYNAAVLPGQVAGGIMHTPPAQPGMWSDVDEARQQATQGTMMNRAADLGGMVMGGSYAAAPAMKNATGMGIRAYHGSPHDFDRFDLSKIGTGEGAQAYGHGLYFAEREAVAKGYRDALKDGRSLPIDRPAAQKILDEHGGDVGAAEQYMRAQAERMKAAGLPDISRRFDDMAMALRSPPEGRMYEVDIKANPEQFLDWDKPVFGQAAPVAEVLSKLGIDTTPRRGWSVEPTSGGKYTVRNVWGEPAGTFKDQAAAQAKADAGNQKHYSGGGGLVYSNLGGNAAYPHLDKGQASQKLLDAGIPGIKYLDQGSRGAGEGSRNYVVFDDRLVDILRKYGIMGASVIPGMGLMGAESPAQAAP